MFLIKGKKNLEEDYFKVIEDNFLEEDFIQGGVCDVDFNLIDNLLNMV